LGVIGLAAPAVCVLGAVVDEQQHAGGRQALHQGVQACLRLGMDPVQVLKDQQQGLRLTFPQQQAFQRLQGALAALGGVEGLPRCIVNRDVQKRQQRRQGRPQGRIQRQQLAGDLLANLARFLAVVDLEVALQQVTDGKVGGRLAIGDRVAVEDQPPRRAMRVGELVEETRFAHSRLADDRHELAVASSGAFQGLAERFELRRPPYETGEPAGGGSLQARPRGHGPDQLEHLHRVGQALDRHQTERPDLHQSFGQPQGLHRDEHRARLRHLLHAGRQVGGLAHRRVVHMQAAVDGAHDHCPGIEPDPDLERHAVGALHLIAVTRDALLHAQRRVAGAHSMVFMGQWRAEERHNAIAHDLVDGPFIAMHRLDHALENWIEDLPCLFGVAIGQQLRGAFEVGEEHRHLLALAFERGPGLQDLLGEMVGNVGRRCPSRVGGRHFGGGRLTGPDQHLAILIDGQPFGIDQLSFQVLEVFFIQVEAPPEGAVGHAPVALQQVEHFV
jgi:hypothetical protein